MLKVAIVLLALLAPAATRDVPPATPTGPAQQCIPIQSIRQSHVRSDQVIDFEMAGGRFYRVTLPQSCPELGFEEAFTYRADNEQLCSVDTITVLHRASPVRGVTCGLGPFQPVTIAGRERR